MQNDSVKFKIFIAFAILVLMIGAIFIVIKGGGEESNALDDFARCLTDKGATMYGAEWCSHCQNEKKAFGDSFRFVRYVECPDNPKQCLAAGIAGVPTWIFPDGRKLEGEQGLEKLSAESGCQLP